jgi:hypothetical protein
MSEPRSSSTRFLLAIFALAMFNASIMGCAQNVFSSQQKGFTKGNDCLFCHSSNGAVGVRDFNAIYANPGVHHPVGMEYPLGPASREDFNQPNGYVDDTIFFDDDGFGGLDVDDVRLYGTGNAVTVECGSCHKEHDESSVSSKEISNHFLRLTNEGSKLCLVCHYK